MKGTVVMRFVGNKQEPEDCLIPDGQGFLFWPPSLPPIIDEVMNDLRKRMVKELQIPEELLGKKL